MALRLGELYLIRAECEAQTGDFADATRDVNAIRERAGLNDTSGNDISTLMSIIDHERQVELFAEDWGDRWLNLKRRGTVDSVMIIVTPEKGGSGWQSFQQYYPISITEIQADPNLKQT